MYSTIIFLSISIIFLSLMLMIDIQVDLDVNKMKIIVIIKIYKIKIVTLHIHLLGMVYRVNRSKKFKKINFVISDEQKILIAQIKKSILDKLYYDNFNVEILLSTQSPDFTSLSIGLINQICLLIKSYLIFSHKESELTFLNKANFISDENKINFDMRVYFTIFDMVFAIILSFYKRGKYVKQAK